MVARQVREIAKTVEDEEQCYTQSVTVLQTATDASDRTCLATLHYV